MTRRPRLRLAALLALLALLITGCGGSANASQPSADPGQLTGHHLADSDNDGAYLEAGGITYQLQLSRQLNPWGTEDSQYIQGLPAGTTRTGLPADDLWYGVFLWAKNQHHRSYTTPPSDRFELVDTLGNVYRPVPLDFHDNPYAWAPQTLQFGETEPGEDSTAANGFTGGKLLLFKLNTTIYSNRPLTLFILSSSNRRIGEISLDL